MEALEIHSKAFLIKWISAPEYGTVHWQLRPTKKSINFSIFRRVPTFDQDSNGSLHVAYSHLSAPSNRPRSSSTATVLAPPTSDVLTSTTLSTATNLNLDERLRNSGLASVYVHGKCHAFTHIKGSFKVPKGGGGMYAFVFDNTFSKTMSKTVQFAYSVESDSRRSSKIHLPSSQGSEVNMRASITVDPPANTTSSKPTTNRELPTLGLVTPSESSELQFFSGVLLKKRRKKMQGYARRYFTLDVTSGQLCYYHDASCARLRGSIALIIAAVSVKPATREIFIDSGVEIWNMRALSKTDFESWKVALEQARIYALATRPSSPLTSPPTLSPRLSPIRSPSPLPPLYNGVVISEADWASLQEMGSRISQALSIVRELNGESTSSLKRTGADQIAAGPALHQSYFALDAAVEHLTSKSQGSSPSIATSFQTPSTSQQPILQPPANPGPKRSFWRKRSSTRDSSSAPSLLQSESLSSATPSQESNELHHYQNRSSHHFQNEPYPVTNSTTNSEELSRLLESLLEQQGQIIKGGQYLTGTSGLTRKVSLTQPAVNRLSVDALSITSDTEFYDAQEDVGVVVLPDNGDPVEDIVVVSEAVGDDDNDEDEDDEEYGPVEKGNANTHSRNGSRRWSSSTSSSEEEEMLQGLSHKMTIVTAQNSAEPNEVHRDLSPLPISGPVARRNAVPPYAVPPPSLIQFVRKNVGKDLSTVAMPVTANEPLSLLQRYAESLEYSELLDQASHADVKSGEQMMYLAAFAISTLSNSRNNQRAIRKPFNPLLNETYELVREDKKFRYFAEKISHRPPVMATYAEGERWSYSFSPQPAQKFWGKSAEVISDGPVTVGIITSVSKSTTYRYTMPTTYLRNMLAGEKYIEPSGTMTISASSGHKCLIEFKRKSMFSGKCEDVVVTITGPQNQVIENVSMIGTWTNEMVRKSSGAVVWRAGALQAEPRKRYGMPQFCAALNEITAVEKGHLAPTDSRLRPDQRYLEEGKVEDAELTKAKLEEMQRDRRKQGLIPTEGVNAIWFSKVEEGVWVPIEGKEGYWDCRKDGRWEKCIQLW
ncbi:Oxysterol-binding protein-domain-containing protein [Lipomyces oligophaga]|uniref:Oxysterol-binding protein-domain-containing protein n=1 Tax=Lipomyces oligophaga TaxID=45792 RepID=UPI0034CF2BFD